MIKCSECKKDILKLTKYSDWLFLFNFVEYLYLDKQIEDPLYEELVNKLMSFKRFADKEE